MIRLDDVGRRYGAETALRGVSLEVPPGAVHALVGPNGAGKTTALRILATLETPTDGSAAVDGHPAAREPRAVRERIGFLGHDAPVYPELTPREHLAFDARARGTTPDEAGVDALLEAVALAPDAPARRLSRGNRRRLGLARALVGDPPALLLDEPFAALDPSGREAVADLVAADPSRAVLLASHDLALAARVADRLHVLRDGALVGDVDAGDAEAARAEARGLLEGDP